MKKIDFGEDLPIEKKDTKKWHNLPDEIKFCKECTMSNQRPRITFDENGVCSACNFWKEKDYDINWKERQQMLQELCDKHRSKDGSWDIVVPGSGGKDSGMVAHMLKHKYRMHPLTVTWASHIDTDIGKQNLHDFIYSGFDNIFGHPNGIVNRRLTRTSFEVMGDVFLPFIYGVNTFPLRIAVNYGIPLVFYGENGEVEYGGDAKNEESARRNTTDDIFKHYFSSYSVEHWKQYGFTDEELHCYKLPPQQKMRDLGLECHFFGYYHKWNPKNNAEYAYKNTGYRYNPEGRTEGTYETYASLDDKTDGLHFYLSFAKFGIGRATHVSSQEIRSKHLTRNRALELLRKYDGEFPARHFNECLDYMGLTEERLWKIVDSFRSDHIWKRTKNGWRLRKAIYDEVSSKETPGYITSLNEWRNKK